MFSILNNVVDRIEDVVTDLTDTTVIQMVSGISSDILNIRIRFGLADNNDRDLDNDIPIPVSVASTEVPELQGFLVIVQTLQKNHIDTSFF